MHVVKAAPLPDGMLCLLLIASDDEEAQGAGAEATGRSRDVVKIAAAFFIEQVLLSAESDSYRVLGARDTASNAELRRNMALLLKALHPDLDQNKDRSVFAGRVTRAWEDLKTQDRRDAYDRARQSRATGGPGEGHRPDSKAKSVKSRNQKSPNGLGLIKKPAALRRTAYADRGARTSFVRRAWIFLTGSNKT